ncbi:AraC family transcriptional regulator [Bifidobacterium sp. ESL0784]|uniref:helix-turn-helix transcriptional regulator n=1 Tax=Bifidobacterium sp. ESL0784 TaxID=2983231 RepID=UPI0023F94798|nr:AraC family transcriptional regulator [Bifidobacterium sp. ESL0784]
MQGHHDREPSQIITADYLEEKLYPTEYPALIIIHDNNHEHVPAHWHRGMEIAHADKGTLQLSLDAEHHTITTGDTLLISPYTIHHAFIDSPYQGISITFNAEVVDRLYPFADRCLFKWFAPTASDDDREEVNEIIEEVRRLFISRKIGDGFLLNAALYRLLALLYTNFICGTRKPEEIRRGRNIVQAVIGYIDSHHAEAITETFVAREFGYSREYFSRFFKKAIGKGFKEYLTELRLKDAHAMLLSSHASLSDICAKTGFPNTTSLSKSFYERYHVTPKEFRRQNR